MKVGIILLSLNGLYVSSDGMLPRRPKFDKELLLGIIKDKKVLCSPNTLAGLPKSILDSAYFTTNVNADYDINFGIDTFKTARPDMLIVVRSGHSLDEGKKFDLTGFKQLVSQANLEIWI